MSFLELRDVSKYYESCAAVRRATINVDEGEMLAVVGRNGSGKSTLLRLIAGTERPDEGETRVQGLDFSSANIFNNFRMMQGIGYYTDKPMLYADLTVRENLKLFFCLNSKKNVDNSSAYFKQLIERFGLNEVYDKQVRSCSAGTIRRVSLVRALLGKPKLIILDEPLAHLDVDSRKEAIGFFRELLKTNVVMVVATHEDEIVDNCATNVFELTKET